MIPVFADHCGALRAPRDLHRALEGTAAPAVEAFGTTNVHVATDQKELLRSAPLYRVPIVEQAPSTTTGTPHPPGTAGLRLAHPAQEGNGPVGFLSPCALGVTADRLRHAADVLATGGGPRAASAAPPTDHPCQAVTPCTVETVLAIHQVDCGTTQPFGYFWKWRRHLSEATPCGCQRLADDLAALAADSAGEARAREALPDGLRTAPLAGVGLAPDGSTQRHFLFRTADGGTLVSLEESFPHGTAHVLAHAPSASHMQTARRGAGNGRHGIVVFPETLPEDFRVLFLFGCAPCAPDRCDITLPYVPTGAPWRRDSASGALVLADTGRPIQGRQTFPPVLMLDQGLCLAVNDDAMADMEAWAQGDFALLEGVLDGVAQTGADLETNRQPSGADDG